MTRGSGRVRPGGFVVLMVAVAVGGCATLVERPENREFEDERMTVRVINDNFYDVTVFAEFDGHRERIGRVVGNRTEVFPLPARATPGTTVAITVSVQAGGTFTSNRVTVWPGEEIRLNVPPDLHRR